MPKSIPKFALPQRLTEQLVGHAGIFSVLCALITFSAVVLLELAVVVEIGLAAIRDTHRSAGLVIREVTKEAQQLLATLESEADTRCEPPRLAALNRLLFRYRHIRDIGVIDENNRLRCTSNLGTLNAHFDESRAIIVTPTGSEIKIDQPVLLGDGQIEATIIRRGAFNVVLDPYVTRSVFEQVDAVWIVQPVGLIPIHFSGAAIGKMDMLAARSNAYPDIPAGLVRDGLSFDVLDQVQETPLLVHTRRSSAELLLQHRTWITPGLFLAIIIAALVYLAVRLKLKELNHINHRIRYLCNRRHLVCRYQPIVTLATGRIVGCEVLMRIRDGNQMLSPAETIAAIQANQLEWQLDSTITQLALEELIDQLPPTQGFKVAINYFPSSIHFDLIDQIVAPLLSSTSRRDINICVEVTEYGFANEVIEQVGLLEKAGYVISVDDFGTGFSNLSVVKRVAPQFLKIDRSFVFEMEDASIKSTLIPEIVNIAHAVGAETIAEGIENTTQRERLAAMGIEYGQGYLFGRPEPIAVFVAQVASQLDHVA